MCMGGKSADSYYQEMKVDYGALPSLRMSAKDKKENVLKDVVRKNKTRSLLNPMGDTNA